MWRTVVPLDTWLCDPNQELELTFQRSEPSVWPRCNRCEPPARCSSHMPVWKCHKPTTSAVGGAEKQTNKENKQQQSLFTHSKCCLIWVSSAYLEMPLINKVRFTCVTKNKRFTRLCTGFGIYIYIFYDESVRYQVVLLVVHLRRVSPHAVDGQEQIHEGKGRMEPQKICPEKQQSSVRISNGNTTTSNLWKYLSNICGSETCN